MSFFIRTAALTAAGLAVAAGPAAGDPVADFYRGKQVSMVVGAPAGGGYGLNARIIARHMARHIPGNPTIVPRFMAGGGGVPAANYMYNAAPKDGSTIGMPIASIPLSQVLLATKSVKFDAAKFAWIGNVASFTNVLAVWHTAPAKTVGDATRTELVIGASGKGSFLYYEPALMNALLGTKFRLVLGYKGSSDLNLALERGEVQGRHFPWASLKGSNPHWIRDGLVVPLLQVGPHKDPDLPNVPSFIDLVRTDKHRRMVSLLHVNTKIARSVYAPPGVPKDRVAALRAALAATVKDPAFLADMKKSKQPVVPLSGEALQAFIASVIDTPPELIGEMRAAIGFAAN
jgi:tripartite-type tricarboxylate transporter receptor subunit TctC